MADTNVINVIVIDVIFARYIALRLTKTQRGLYTVNSLVLYTDSSNILL